MRARDLYQPDKVLSIPMREEIINLYKQSYRDTMEISRDLKVTERTVRIYRSYEIDITPYHAVGGTQVNAMNADLLEEIEIWKL